MSIDIEAAYRSHGPMVLRRCRSLLRNEEAAVDATHDVFVKLLRHDHRLEDRGLCSLLYTMATRECLNALRSDRRRPAADGDAVLHDIAALDDHAGASDLRSFLDRLFAKEPASTRVMAVLHHVDGMTYDEVAAVVGLSVSGVRKRLRGLQLRALALAERT